MKHRFPSFFTDFHHFSLFFTDFHRFSPFFTVSPGFPIFHGPCGELVSAVAVSSQAYIHCFHSQMLAIMLIDVVNERKKPLHITRTR